MRSSSSVVTPGATCLPTSARARAASRPATRMRAIVSASLTSGSPVFGYRLPTYSGGTMFAGTFRSGEIRPGWSNVVMIWKCSSHER